MEHKRCWLNFRRGSTDPEVQSLNGKPQYRKPVAPPTGIAASRRRSGGCTVERICLKLNSRSQDDGVSEIDLADRILVFR